ncbi:MAG: response regulator transcription factor [Verrucomicrobiota bacterium]
MSSRILLIEDDASLRRGLEDNLRAAGWEVRVASDGEHGLELALAWKADLILLDIMLPGVNGYQICRHLRQEDIQVPLLMLTARGQTEDVVRGLDLGADDYLIKPFALAELLARVRRLLRQAPSARTRIPLGSQLELDLTARTLHGSDLVLTPKEFGLLAHLVQHPERAFTRAQLLREVWGPGLFVTERSVDRAVRTLRAKLGSASQALQTIRGIGYRWDPSP